MAMKKSKSVKTEPKSPANMQRSKPSQVGAKASKVGASGGYKMQKTVRPLGQKPKK
jgi:hypothetical protein